MFVAIEYVSDNERCYPILFLLHLNFYLCLLLPFNPFYSFGLCFHYTTTGMQLR